MRRTQVPWQILLAASTTLGPLSAQRLPRIEGGVVDALHEPVRAAEVWAWAGGRVVARTRTDGEGSFALANLPPEEVVAFARAAGTSLGGKRLDLGDREDVLLWLRVFPGRTVRGTVTAAGKPLAGVHVVADAHPRCLDDADPRAVTDEHGRYELANVAIGEVTVRAWGPGFDMGERRIDGTEEPAVDFALQPATTTITFALGKATSEQLAAATFVLRSEFEGAPVALPLPLERGRPDASGEWRLAGWPNHVDVRYARVDLPGSRAVPWRHEVVRAKDGLRVEFEARSPEDAQLRGVLRGPDDEPLGGKELLLRPFDDHPGSMRVVRGTTGVDGTFAMPCPVDWTDWFAMRLLDEGHVLDHLRSQHPSGRAWHVETFGGPGSPVRLQAVPALHVRGRVRDAEGRAIAGLALEVYAARQGGLFGVGHTLIDGSFEFVGLDAEGLQQAFLLGSSPRWRCRSAPFAIAGGTTVEAPEVTLTSAQSITGRVRRAGGEPLAGVRVDLGTADTITDREGRFRFVALMPGPHSVRAASGGKRGRKEVQLEDDGDAHVEIELR